MGKSSEGAHTRSSLFLACHAQHRLSSQTLTTICLFPCINFMDDLTRAADCHAIKQHWRLMTMHMLLTRWVPFTQERETWLWLSVICLAVGQDAGKRL